MCNALLDMIPMHERHSGTNIAETLMNSVRYYGIGSHILSATTDNAANMETFGREFSRMLYEEFGNTKFVHVRCAAHVLNLMVQEGLSKVSPAITKARHFTSHVRNSQPMREELKKLFVLKNMAPLIPELDTVTRWNSTYKMVNRLSEIREVMDMLVASNPRLKTMYPMEEDWEDLSVSIASC
jgi:hypothetical protein